MCKSFSLTLKCFQHPYLFPALCEWRCNSGHIWQQLHTLTVCRTVQDLLSWWWQAVNHQSSHKASESLFITRSLPTHTVLWECFPPLHGDLKADMFQSARIQKTSGISLSRLTAYREGLIRPWQPSGLYKLTFQFTTQSIWSVPTLPCLEKSTQSLSHSLPMEKARGCKSCRHQFTHIQQDW